jgi:hypothetical protein
MKTRKIENPEDRAEGLCLGYAYNTELVSSAGVNVHFWLGDNETPELAARLLARMRRERDIVCCTYSGGAPVGFWARCDVTA